MTDELRNKAKPDNDARAQRRWYKTPLAAMIVALGVGAGGIATADAFGFGDGKRGMRAHHARAMEDPAEMEKRIERGIRHLAIEIDATSEQEAEPSSSGITAWLIIVGIVLNVRWRLALSLAPLLTCSALGLGNHRLHVREERREERRERERKSE